MNHTVIGQGDIAKIRFSRAVELVTYFKDKGQKIGCELQASLLNQVYNDLLECINDCNKTIKD